MKNTKLFGCLMVIMLSGVTAWSTRATAAVAAGSASVVISFEESAGTPGVAREAVLSLAAGYAGLAPEGVISARYGLATDTSIPFLEVVRRPAWEITFGGVNVSVATWAGTTVQNPNISTLTVLLDGNTGALLKVSSPQPAAGALAAEPAPTSAASWCWTHSLTLQTTAAGPAATFMEALQYAETRKANSASGAGEVNACFGLLTDARPLWNLNQTPCWIVLFGGVSLPVPGGAEPAIKAMLVLDASTGESYGVRMYSPPKQ